MKSALAFIVAMVMVLEVRTFDPQVTFTCAAGPVYTFAVTCGAVGGTIYIGGHCGFQHFSKETEQFEFSNASCAGVPDFGDTFDVFILENANIEVKSDKIFRSTCRKNLTTNIYTVSAGNVSPDTQYVSKNKSLSPKFTMAIVNGTTEAAIVSGTVGDAVRIKIELNSTQKDTFGYRVKELYSTNTNLIDDGCIKSNYPGIITQQPHLPDGEGIMYVFFNLFRPVSSESTEPSTLTLSVELDVCDSMCDQYNCPAGRRRRRDDGLDPTSGDAPYKSVTMSTSILVFPKDYESTKKTEVDYENDVSFARSPMLGLMLGLCIALVVCICVSTWLFCKLRKSGGRLNANEAHSNNGFKA